MPSRCHDLLTKTLALRWRVDGGEFQQYREYGGVHYIDFPPVDAVDANRRRNEAIFCDEEGQRR